MSFSQEERLQFVAWMSDLGPDCERSRMVNFVGSRREAALIELTEVSACEQVRAGLLRLLTELVPEGQEREVILKKVGTALTTVTPEASTDLAGTLTRHPAWIGLSVLEYCDWAGRTEGQLDWAVELAGLAFVQRGGDYGAGRGEILWAMAEQAESVGWSSRSTQLLNEAFLSAFSVDEHQQQVALLVALRRLDQSRSGAEDILDDILRSDKGDDQTRMHAAWVKAHLLKDRGERPAAVSCLQTALATLEESPPVSISERIQAFVCEMKG
jgi:hypothetical protein